MNTYFDWVPTEIISGGASGVDTYAEKTADYLKCKFKKFPADWDGLGESAGHIRNAQMADYGEALFAAWDGSSYGTKNMIDTARKKKLIVKVVVINYDGMQLLKDE